MQKFYFLNGGRKRLPWGRKNSKEIASYGVCLTELHGSGNNDFSLMCGATSRGKLCCCYHVFLDVSRLSQFQGGYVCFHLSSSRIPIKVPREICGYTWCRLFQPPQAIIHLEFFSSGSQIRVRGKPLMEDIIVNGELSTFFTPRKTCCYSSTHRNDLFFFKYLWNGSGSSGRNPRAYDTLPIKLFRCLQDMEVLLLEWLLPWVDQD